jgi:hypothetical protein
VKQLFLQLGVQLKRKTHDESWIFERQAFSLANKLTGILAGPTYSAPGGGGRYVRVYL